MKPPQFTFRKPALRITIISILAIALISITSVGIAVYRIIAATPSLEEYQSTEQGPVVFDSEGEELGPLREEQQVHVSIDDIPDEVIQAVVAIEDRRFFRHRGIDLRGIARAAWRNLRAGRIVQGASTLTQQLARTLYLSRERTMARKISESYLALQIERRYEKEEILEMYLNEVYFGGGATGVEAASMRFFDKPVEEVNRAEAAMLAGSLRSPLHYNPVANPERSRRRLSVVLSAMETAGFITAEEADEALREEPDPVDPDERDDLAADFVGHVRDKLIDRFDGENLYQHELEIHTTLDRTRQEEAERSIEEGFDEETLPTVSDTDEPVNERQPQAALVSVDSRSGAIEAMVGGRGGDAYNRATMTTRQPGSAFKPFIYSAAFEERGYHPGTVVNDMPISAPVPEDGENGSTHVLAGLDSRAVPAAEEAEDPDAREVWPRNFDNRYRGLVSFREALARSLNVPAVRIVEEIGIETAFEHIERFGFTSFTDEDGQAGHYSLALGGLEEGVTPVEMAAAYTPFANGGLRSEPYTIEKIVNEDGETIYEADTGIESVISEDVAYLLRDMLRSAVEEGTGARARLEDTPVAGKTGTTDLNTDGWFVGFADYTVTSIWAGEDRAIPMKYQRINDDGDNENKAPYERAQGDNVDAEVLGVDVSEIWADYSSGVPEEADDALHARAIAEELDFGGTDTLEPVDPAIASIGHYRWDDRPASISEFPMNPVTGLPATLHHSISETQYAPDFHERVDRELRRSDREIERLSLVPLPLSDNARFYSSDANDIAPELPPFTYQTGGTVVSIGDDEHVRTSTDQPFTGTYEESENRPLQPIDGEYRLPYSPHHPYFVPSIALLPAGQMPTELTR